MYWATGILGLILAVAPFIFGYSNNTAALWASVLIGAATVVVSWIEGARRDRERWEYWTAIVLGVVAIISPFLFGYNRSPSAMWSSIVTGVLIAVFAGSRLFTARKV